MESDDLAAIFGDAVAFDHLDSKYSEVMFQQVAALFQHGCREQSGPVATPQPIEEATLLGRHAAYISRTITASYPDGMDSELVMRRRVDKIFVEAGELGDAIEGWTGENPRKGVYATREDVIKELIDCASASLCAIEYMTGDAGLSVEMVARQVIGNAQRLSESIPDHCEPDVGPVATPTEPERAEDIDLEPVVVELRDLWQRALEREGRLASAVADVIGKATPYGQGEDGAIAAYLTPAGCMHRLVGVAQQNGAHVPVAFRNSTELFSEADAVAEAVADERQRAADELREVERKAAVAGNWTLHDFMREVRLIREGWAIGSVPVATPPDPPCIECGHLESEHDMERDGDCRALVTYRHEMPCVDGKSLVGRSQSECDRCPGFTHGPVATPTEPRQALGARLADARARLGKSYAQVAGETGLSTSVLYGAEHGKDVRVSTATVLERWLAASPVPAEQAGDGDN